MANLALAFDILARDKGASRTFDNVGDSAERAGKKGRGFGSAIKAGLGIASGAFAAVGLANLIGSVSGALSDSIAEAREAEKVGKTTAQIIKSTGGAAKVSAKDVGALAESLSVKAGVDDELIQSGANLLLTFKNVRNEAGKGADIFDRATAAAVDLSATGFGDVNSASKRLGKALDDPVKGMAALSKAGVTFTQQQKDQIKTLMASGDVLGAQKIILGEVESQVGGVAAASATMGEKVSVAFGNLKERVGTALLPVLDRLGSWFLDKGLPAIERFGGWISGNLWPALEKGHKTVLPGLTKALDVLTGGTGEGEMSWKKFGAIITDKVIPFIADLTSVYLPAWAVQIRTIIETAKAAWKVFETWRDIVLRVASVIMGAFLGITDVFAAMLRALGKVPGFGWAKDAADKMQTAADKARSIKAAIDAIPSSKSVRVNLSTTGAIRLPNGVNVAPGVWNGERRAKGGPVTQGRPYAVGDNPDGSWNKTTEMFFPGRSGRIVNQKDLAAAMGSSAAGATENVDASVHIHGGTFGPTLGEIEREASRRRRTGSLSPSLAGAR